MIDSKMGVVNNSKQKNTVKSEDLSSSHCVTTDQFSYTLQKNHFNFLGLFPHLENGEELNDLRSKFLLTIYESVRQKERTCDCK